MKVTALTQRNGRWWVIELPNIPGGHTQAARFSEVGTMARDAAALLLDLPLEEVEVDVVVDEGLLARMEASESA